MKNLKLAAILMLLSIGTSVNAQLPFDVVAKYEVSGKDTIKVESPITNVQLKLKPNTHSIKLLMSNRNYNVSVRTKKMYIRNIEYTEDDIMYGFRTYSCVSKELGNVIIETEVKTMTGRILIDRDCNGEFEEILMLN